jgi:hypothetical protein
MSSSDATDSFNTFGSFTHNDLPLSGESPVPFSLDVRYRISVPSTVTPNLYFKQDSAVLKIQHKGTARGSRIHHFWPCSSAHRKLPFQTRQLQLSSPLVISSFGDHFKAQKPVMKSFEVTENFILAE